MNKITQIETTLIKYEKLLLTVLVIIMAVFSFFQVVLRITAGKSVLWIDPLLRYFVLWAGFLGGSLAAASNKHFALDILTGKLKGRPAKILRLINGFFTGSVCVVLMIAAVNFIKSETDFNTVLLSIGNFNVPAIYLEFMIPLGFALIIFHTIAGFFKKR